MVLESFKIVQTNLSVPLQKAIKKEDVLNSNSSEK
jgi:hypothetical protein